MERIKKILSNISGIPALTEDELASFSRLAEILVEENKKVNVTSITSPVGIALKHFADSLSLATVDEIRKKGIRMADIGCGGGFPGLPIKIVRPDIDITMVDSTEKKIRYVRETADKLSLEGVTTISARAEELAGKGGKGREAFDIVTARALARLNVLSELCLPFCKVGGTFVSMKAASAEEELAEARNAILRLGGRVKRVEEVHFGLDTSGFDEKDSEDIAEFLSAKRYLLVIEKVMKTPDEYPRQYAKILKKPL